VGKHIGIVRVASEFVDETKAHMPANATIIAESAMQEFDNNVTYLKVECADFPEVVDREAHLPFFNMWLHRFDDGHVEFEKWDRVDA
jgi:hypothetical protein